MDIKKLQKIVVAALEDTKAQDIKMFDTTELTSLFDRMCIASGTSNRQTKALAASVRDKVKENGGQVIGVEGDDIGEWVLVDLGDMVVHIMQPVIRAYYRLEELWGEKEVKLGAAKRISKRTAEVVEEAPAKPKRVSKAKATVTETKKAAPRKSASAAGKKVAAPAKKAAAKKVVTKKTVTKRKIDA